jgi:alpha-2-macroglobulin
MFGIRASRLVIALTTVFGGLGLGACGSCGSCGGEGVLRDGALVAPGERPPLELEPLPSPPAIEVAPGSIPGIPAGPVAVVAARPQGPTRGDARPAITFNKPLVALGDRDAAAPPAVRITPPLPGTWRWIGSSSIELHPEGDIPWATRFTVTVDAGLTAVDGSKLEDPYTFSFETLAPELTRSDPPEGWRWLPQDGRIRLFFNQPMRDDLSSHIAITANGAPVSFTVAEVVDVAAEDAKKRGLSPPRERRSWGRTMRYELALAKKLPPAAKVAVEIKGGLAGAEGPLTVEPRRIAFEVAGPMKILSVRACDRWEHSCPYGPILLSMTNEPELASLKGRVHFDPPAEIDEEELGARTTIEDGAWAAIPARFRPGTTYKVTVDAGVQDAQGQKAPAFTARVQLHDVEPSLHVGSPLALLEGGGDDSYPLEAVNVRAVTAGIEALTPAQVAPLLSGDPRTPIAATTTVTKTVDTSSERNVAVRRPLPLGDVFAPGAPKIFRLSLSAREAGVDKRIVLGQITDVAAHAKLGATSGVVWVTSIAKGTPLAGARVTLWSEAGAELFTATTDAEGLARVPGLAGLVKMPPDESWWAVPPVLVSAEKDGDTGVTLSTWEGELGPMSSALSIDFEGDRPRAAGLLVAERGIYRPGDEVYLKGVVRLRRRGQLSLPKLDSQMELKITARGKEVSKEKVAVSRFGTFSTKLKLPDGAGLGWYTASAKALVEGAPVELQTSFRVEEYRAPRFKVDVRAAAEHLVAGDALLARTEARTLFGGGIPGAEAEVTAIRSTEFFTPGAPGGALARWQFGVQTWGYDDGAPELYGDVFAREKTRLGADGGADIDLGAVEAPAGRTTRYTVEAEVSDVSRQRVANRASVLVHPAAVYVGVRPGDGFGEVGKAIPIELVATSIEGTRLAGVPIAVKIKRREWRSIKKKDPYSGRFQTLSEPEEVQVATCERKSDASAPALCELVADKAGFYVIEATATDERGRTQTTRVSSYVVGGGWVSWQRTDGESLELVADKPSYEPGERARILVKSPWPDAEALVTVEREGVAYVKRHRLKGAAATLEVPLDDQSVPNVFASVVLVRGRVATEQGAPRDIDPGRPQVRVGYTRLTVEKKKKRLDVHVDPGAGPHKPGARLKIKLAVRDFQKKGAAAELTLWAVDEAVLRLTDYRPPDIVDAMHPQRGLSVRLGEPLIHLVRRQGYGEKGRPPGGDGGGAGGGFRSNFKTTAFFLPSVLTDAQGNAEVEVQLPDDLTTYRVMALAVTEGDQAGLGSAEIVVQKPLLALPALPRVARVGDRFSAGVVVHARHGGDVKVTAEVSGAVPVAALELEGPAARTVHVEAGRALEVRFSFVAAAAGRARLRFRVEGGGESDGVEHFLPVIVPTFIETVAAAGDVSGDVPGDVPGRAAERQEALKKPAGVLADVGGLELTLASTALAGYQEALKQLVEYPYGCAEQLASRLVPFLALRELQGAFGLKHEGGAADQALYTRWLGFSDDAVAPPDEVAKTSLRALEALQAPDGGFLYWGSSSCADPFASAYATLALARAKELGYPVSDDVVARGQRFLAQKVAVDRLPACSWGARAATPVERAFAVWVLARTGAPHNGTLEVLFNQRTELPLFAKAMLADAHFVGGAAAARSPRAQTLLQEVMNGARETAREVHFEETDPGRWRSYWSSDVRTTAIVLMMLVDAVPEHPFVQKAAAWLQTARKGGRYRNTQEAAYALMAVTELMRAKEREPPDFRARVSLGGKVVVDEAFTGRSLDLVSRRVPMRELGAGPAGSESALAFSKEGKGTLSYTAALRYAKAEMPVTPLDAGLGVQRWFEPWASTAGAGQAKRVRAGELVRVRVRVASPAERRFVAVEVPLPAGLEIVDESLASSGRGALAGAGRSGGAGDRGDGEEGSSEEGFYEEGYYEDEDGYAEPEPFVWSPFNHVELRDDRAVFFADVLPPGVHTATVVARATTIGRFVLKPATAEEMYAPEISGRSDGGAFEVVEQ